MSPQPSSDVPETTSLTSDGTLPVPRKRKRTVLSCLDCRRRKVKCDHGLPACGRCKQRGVASLCTYEYAPGDEYVYQGDSTIPDNDDAPMMKTAPEPPILDQPRGTMAAQIPLAPMSAYLEQRDMIERLENRLKVLEKVVAHGSSGQSSLEPQGDIPRQPEANFFKGRGFRTQFYGPSCPNSVLASVCIFIRSYSWWTNFGSFRRSGRL
jgi:hypothetical protein